MLKDILQVKYVAAFATLLMVLFIWAGLTGTRLLGDDKETVENRAKQGAGHYTGRSHRYGGRSSFYHK